MSWLQKLYETYEACAGSPQFERDPLLPICHSEQRAQIEIVLDGEGVFQRAATVPNEPTRIPVTERSAGRTSGSAAHPLCDKLVYCAGDYSKYGGAKESPFDEYVEQLQLWQESDPHPKVQAVLRYVKQSRVISDLIEAGIVHCDSSGKLKTEWGLETPMPALFKLLTPDKSGHRDQGDAFVRWRVQIPGELVSAVWEDPSIAESWIRFCGSGETSQGLCMVTGERAELATNHPRRIRHPGDGAKLISANDERGFTFRGRVNEALQASGVSMAVSQKAHNALRWLLRRQGYKNGSQAFVAWSVAGKKIPDPFADTAVLFGAIPSETPSLELSSIGDAGQHFAMRLRRAIAGYQAELSGSDEVIVMGLDSAVPGRLAITYYRELGVQEFLGRVENWHAGCAWPQRYSKALHFIGAPAPADIAEAAYGRRLDEKLRKAAIERLVPCIVDARPIPRDLVDSTVRQACNWAGLKGRWQWEKRLGIACALVRGQRKEERYEMPLEEDRRTRDYLFGRLLAIADNIEQRALRLSNEDRETNAMKLLQRFANHPSSTWRSIEIALGPYKARLRARRPAVLLEREKLLDGVSCMFSTDEFTSDRKLTGEFLLGFHCQRAKLWSKNDVPAEGPAEESDSEKDGDKDE